MEAAAQAAAAPAAAQRRPRRTWKIATRFAHWEVDHDRFEFKRILGKGSYGSVAEAWDHHLNQRVAIKKIYDVFSVFENAKRIYREIKLLRMLEHVNIIKIVHLQRPPNLAEFADLYVAFECMDTDLAKLIRDDTQCLTVPHVRWFLYQELLGLKFLHSAGVLHRDLKPANLLLTEACDLKICDFGLARALYTAIDADAATDRAGMATREVDAPAGAQINRQLTSHVVTRWYRAPEVILGDTYGPAIDTWSVGCILAEMYGMLDTGDDMPAPARRALFPGGSCYPLSKGNVKKSSGKQVRQDQLHVIFQVMGTPSDEEIARVTSQKARDQLRRMDRQRGIDLATKYPTATEEGIDLLRRLLSFLPEDRISVDEALAHPFLAPVRRPADEVVYAAGPIQFPEVTEEKIRDLIVSEIRHFNPEVPADWKQRGL